MERPATPTCRVLRPGRDSYAGRQGFTYTAGVSTETVGARGICMHLLTLQPGERARAHLHANHETAIYALEGESEMWYGDRLEQHAVVRAGEMVYIPAGVPHLPANRSGAPCTVVIARTDPNEQESVVLLPELDGLVPR
ncbi:MAG TPA: cupin domain-containing protein [Amaricoccus sp.]|uniref:cupin domain-containing protein n=1 Tax=Amaricoccus sp. TaxID=1872485 RepID=UPI002C756663|nr:cupin domain-containing protein [Amaricoccus sp.]HRO11652.1 cupin domain-containing protein [Amaricoccus sp.]